MKNDFFFLANLLFFNAKIGNFLEFFSPGVNFDLFC
jgi:hypothetical protein